MDFYCIRTTDKQLVRSGGKARKTLLINIIFAKQKELRNMRWQKAFSVSALAEQNPEDTLDRKATIVIEHLIQVGSYLTMHS